MSILVTISVNLAESASLRELRRFVAMAESHGADLDVDLREYDENGDLVGLAAVGQLEPTDDGRSADGSANDVARHEYAAEDSDADTSAHNHGVEGEDHDGTDARTAD
jgi:hypothetical protein